MNDEEPHITAQTQTRRTFTKSAVASVAAAFFGSHALSETGDEGDTSSYYLTCISEPTADESGAYKNWPKLYWKEWPDDLWPAESDQEKYPFLQLRRPIAGQDDDGKNKPIAKFEDVNRMEIRYELLHWIEYTNPGQHGASEATEPNPETPNYDMPRPGDPYVPEDGGIIKGAATAHFAVVVGFYLDNGPGYKWHWALVEHKAITATTPMQAKITSESDRIATVTGARPNDELITLRVIDLVYEDDDDGFVWDDNDGDTFGWLLCSASILESGREKYAWKVRSTAVFVPRKGVSHEFESFSAAGGVNFSSDFGGTVIGANVEINAEIGTQVDVNHIERRSHLEQLWQLGYKTQEQAEALAAQNLPLVSGVNLEYPYNDYDGIWDVEIPASPDDGDDMTDLDQVVLPELYTSE